jgi:hypothetical protein
MLIALQALTIVAMIVATFLIYQSLGPRRRGLTFSRSEKEEWDQLAKRELGSWLTISNIFGTLTSLATVYVFFIGNTNRFGWWIFAAVVTMWSSSFVTNYCTGVLLKQPKIAARLSGDDQTSANLLSIFWDETRADRHATAIIRWICLVNVSVILWMDFSVFADVSSRLISPNDLATGLILIFFCSSSVIYFTMKYGLRGFVFADLFQSPITIGGTLALFIGAVVVIGGFLARRPEIGNYSTVLLQLNNAMRTPDISVAGGMLFCLSCLFLNSFFVLATPPHWLRLWMFGNKETKLQVKALSITSVLWVFLIGVGALAATDISITGPGQGANSNEVVVFFLHHLTTFGSPLFAVAFWLAGMAALFSSADVQIYSFWLVQRFNTRSGKLGDTSFERLQPLKWSLAAGATFSVLYYAVRALNVPFDQLVLVLIPSCLTIVPSIVLAMRGLKQQPIFLWVSIVLYGFFAIMGLVAGERAQVFAVAAPIMPLAVSVVTFFHRPSRSAVNELRSETP